MNDYTTPHDTVGQRTASSHQLAELMELRKYDAAYRLTQWQNKKGQSRKLEQKVVRKKSSDGGT